MAAKRKSKPPVGKAKIGRPSGYSKEIANAICLLIAEGQSLRTICKRDDMPGQTAVFKYLIEHEDFAKQYARARELQADVLFDECLEIADDATGDFKEHDLGDGAVVSVVDHEHISRSKLRVDTRKWLSGKLAPKKYGDRIQQVITDPDGKALPPTINLIGRPQSPPAPKAVAGLRDSSD